MIVGLLCCHVSDVLFFFRNAQTNLSTLQVKNPPQPPKTLTQDSWLVKASQLSKLNPMSYIFTFLNIMYLISCIYYSCITTFGLVLLQLYQDKVPPTLYLSGISELEQPWWMCVLLSHCYPSTCTCHIAVLLDEAAPTNLTHTLMRDRLSRLTYGLYHISGLGGVRFSNFSDAALAIGRAPKGV